MGLTLITRNPSTKLCAIAKKRVSDQYNRINSELFNFWLQHRTKTGAEFEGSPRLVFWAGDSGGRGIYEQHHPYRLLKKAIETVLMDTAETCRKYELEPEPYIDEAKLLLRGLIGSVYRDMANVDRKLRGEGFPESVKCVDESYYRPRTEELERYLEEHAAAAILIASRPTETEQNTTPAKRRRIIGWIFKKTSHFICAIFVAVIATIIAAIIIDIFADFGWIKRIKEFFTE